MVFGAWTVNTRILVVFVVAPSFFLCVIVTAVLCWHVTRNGGR